MPPKNRRKKLEDLETDELEGYMENLTKKQISAKNAFDYDVIAYEKEIVERSDFSQATNTEANTQSLKMHAKNLDICARVYGHRVENIYRATSDLSEDLHRAIQGKAIKGKKRPQEEEEDDGPEEGDGPVEEGQEPSDKRRKGTKKPRLPRTSHLVDAAKLACPQTDINANLISRFWSLIGNVQPGSMKETWIHGGERLEDAHRVEYILNPDFTCLQRYNGMMRSTASDGGEGSKTHGKKASKVDHAVLKEAEETFYDSMRDLLQRQSKKTARLEDCLSFPKKLEKRLMAAAENAIKKQPRHVAPGYSGKLDIASLDRTCRQLVRGGTLIHPEELDIHFTDLEVDSSRAGSLQPSHGDQTQDDMTFDDAPPMSPDLHEEEPSKTADEVEEENQTMETDTANTPLDSTSAIEEPEEDLSQGFRKPSAPSEASFSKSLSRAGSVGPSPQRLSVDRTSRYGSVMKEINDSGTLGSQRSVRGESETSSVKRKFSMSGGWPDSFEFTAEDIGECYRKMEKGRNKIVTPEKEGTDSLLDYPLRIMMSATAMAYIRHPPSFRIDNILETLNVQTKALLTSLRQKNFLVPGANSSISLDDMAAVFGRTYYEDFDKERLEKQWSNQNDEDYAIPSDDESDHEDDDFDDAQLSFMDETEKSVTSPGGETVEQDASPTPLLEEQETGPRQADLQEGLNDDINMDEELGDGWESSIQPPAPVRRANQVDRPWADMQVSGTRGLTQMTGESSPQDDAVAFAENVALKDLTGSGVNISRMKRGVLKAYRQLVSLRKSYVEKFLPSSGASASPLLTIQHVIDRVPFCLGKKDLSHVNPSVILSCLLHLAYEFDETKKSQKLYLCNSMDLKVLYVLSRAEFDVFTACQPHLNNLNDAYIRRLLNIQVPSVEAGQGGSNPPTMPLNDAMSVLSVSDDESGVSDQEGDTAPSQEQDASDEE